MADLMRSLVHLEPPRLVPLALDRFSPYHEQPEGFGLIPLRPRRDYEFIHPTLDAAILAQLRKVAHTTLLGVSHPTAIELARRLVEHAPEGLNRVFFSDDGATAVENLEDTGDTENTGDVGDTGTEDPEAPTEPADGPTIDVAGWSDAERSALLSGTHTSVPDFTG